MNIKRMTLALLALLITISASAQAVIKVQAPNMVAADEQFNVSFVIEGEHSPSSFTWSAGDDFQLVWGPQKGSSSSITIINGKRTSSTQVSYTYVLLPKSAGKFTLPAAQAVVKGATISSSPFVVEVVGGGQNTASPGSQSQEQSSSQPSDIFMRLTLNKTRVVVGEPVSATLKLYQRINIAGFENAKFPTFNGFWSEETEAPTNIEFHRENVDDNIYNAAVIRRWTLVPQQAGEVVIEPAELICLVNVRDARSSTGSIFDSFFQDDYQTIRKRLATSAVKVTVNRLPAGAPSSFAGGVGKFNMQASLSVDSLKTHDAASLRITITGKGNVPLLEAPKISFPPDFECYDVKSTDVRDGKQFEYPFIPRSHGDFVIGPVEYSYYDISAGKYVTLQSEPLPLKVIKGKDDTSVSFAGQSVAAPAGQKDVRTLGNDVRYMHGRLPVLSSRKKFFAGSAFFWSLFVLVIVAAVSIFVGFRKLARTRADVARTKSKSATKMARKRLSAAGEYLKKDLYSAFYEELHKALLGFISDKLTMDMADMSKENIALRLSQSGVKEDVCNSLVELLDACEYARYSPSSGHDAMNAHYESALTVISTIDDNMHSGKKKSHKGIAAVAGMLMLIPFASNAQETVSADSLWYAGTSAYEEGRWQDARSSWSALADMGFKSDELYYNLGNACYKSADIAWAVVWYNRSLKLNPSNEDARFNLEFVNGMIQDRVESVPEFFLVSWMRKLSYVMASDAWAILFLLCILLAAACALLFFLGRRSVLRKTGFFAGIAALLLAFVCVSFAFSQKAEFESADKAVVVSGVCSVKSSPGASSTDLFIVHEGLTVSVEDQLGEWVNIELSDGRQGWMMKRDIEII